MANILFPGASSQKVLSMFDDDVPLSDEGGYFVATNPTLGTPITGTICVDDAATASSTHAQFAPAFLVYNSAVAGATAPSIYMRYLKFTVVTPPASATAWHYSVRLDNVNRYSSGGSAITPVNTNPLGSITSKALVWAGAIVPTALPSSASRLVAAGVFNSAIPVLNDVYMIDFGGSMNLGSQIGGGTTSKTQGVNAPAVSLPPGWCLAVDMWGASNAATAITFEFEITWAERQPGL